MAAVVTDRMQAALDAMIVGEWMTADWIGERMGLGRSVRRHGNGAVAGSWSGYVAPGLALASTMQALSRRGLVQDRGDPRTSRWRAQYRRLS